MDEHAGELIPLEQAIAAVRWALEPRENIISPEIRSVKALLAALEPELERVKAQRDYYFDKLGRVLNTLADGPIGTEHWSEEMRANLRYWLEVVRAFDTVQEEGSDLSMRQLARTYLDTEVREAPPDE